MDDIKHDVKLVLENQIEHTERLTRIESDLHYHIKRTDLLETMVNPVHKMYIIGKGIIAIAVSVLTLLGAYYSIKAASAHHTPQYKARAAITRLERESGCKLKITSGMRTRAENERVGGAQNSYHLKGMAYDLQVLNKGCISLKSLQRIACKFVSTILYSNHIHIDTRSNQVHLKGWYKWERKKHGPKSRIYSSNYYRSIGCK